MLHDLRLSLAVLRRLFESREFVSVRIEVGIQSADMPLDVAVGLYRERKRLEAEIRGELTRAFTAAVTRPTDSADDLNRLSDFIRLAEFVKVLDRSEAHVAVLGISETVGVALDAARSQRRVRHARRDVEPSGGVRSSQPESKTAIARLIHEVDDDPDDYPAHVFERETERRAAFIVSYGYATLGRYRSRRYEGFSRRRT